jgi:hypothetical protein
MGYQVTPMVRPIVLAGLVVLFPAIVGGQGRAAMPAAGTTHMIAAAPRPVAHGAQPVVAPPHAGARMVGRSGAVRTGTRPNARVKGRPPERRNFNTDHGIRSSACNSSAPGLGFDEVHLAAVCGPEALGAGRHGGGSPFFFPFFDGGYYLPNVPVEEEAAATDTQQQDDADADAHQARRRVRDSEPAPAPAAEPDRTPLPDAEQYVFVRRDGTVFFAVAYAWENGTLRYVTSEGLRRNIAQNALDLNATQQFNEQRGLNFRLPA